MKAKTKVITFFLIFIMLFSCISPAAFAADGKLKQCVGGYLAIGDSNSRGFGSEGYFAGQAENYDLRNVSGSFTTQIAQAVGCVMPNSITDKTGNYWPLCYPGQTVAVTKDLFGIDSSYQDEVYAFELYSEMMSRFGCEESLTGVLGETYSGNSTVGELDDLVKRADLITVELGINDVFARPIIVAARNLGLGDMMHETIYIKDLSSKTKLDLAMAVIEEMYNGLNALKIYFPQMLEKIKTWNPDATVVVVGVYNIVANMTLDDKSVLPIGSTLSAITDTMNNLYKEWAKKYGAIYVDVSNTSSYGSAQEWSIGGDFRTNVSLASHPDQEGHNYIARQIISALPKENQYGTLPSTYIQVDLERIRAVSSVKVNGINVEEYTLDDTILTVPYTSQFGLLLSVGYESSSGKNMVSTYSLTYDNGYTAKRIFNTEDFFAQFQQILELLISLFAK